jgi:hypothetical protein
MVTLFLSEEMDENSIHHKCATYVTRKIGQSISLKGFDLPQIQRLYVIASDRRERGNLAFPENNTLIGFFIMCVWFS